MKTLVINVGDNVDIIDFSAHIKRLYPSLQIVQTNANTNQTKKFDGIDDLKPLYVPNFKMFSREELYDRYTVSERS